MELEYCKVKIEGKVDSDVAIYLGPRSPQAHVPSAMKVFLGPLSFVSR